MGRCAARRSGSASGNSASTGTSHAARSSARPPSRDTIGASTAAAAPIHGSASVRPAGGVRRGISSARITTATTSVSVAGSPALPAGAGGLATSSHSSNATPARHRPPNTAKSAAQESTGAQSASPR